MDDTEPNFGPFAPQPMFEEPKPNGRKTPKKKGGPVGRPKKAKRPPLVSTGGLFIGDPPVPVSVRRPRKMRAVTVDLSTAVTALTGLTSEDGKFVNGVVESMRAFSAKQKRRIVSALGLLFGL